MDIKVLFFPLDPEIVASSRTRVYQYVPYLKEYKISAKVINCISPKRSLYDIKSCQVPLSVRIKSYLYRKLQTIKVLFYAGRHDVVIVHRVLLSIWEQRILRLINPRIIFDFDDALYLVPQSERRLNNMLRISKYLITVSRDNLSYAQEFNKAVSVITTPIDINRYIPGLDKKDNYPVTIGWIGGSSTAKYLEIVKDVFKMLKTKYGEQVVIKFIGSDKLNWNSVNYITVEWNLDTEVKELQSFDIGIMPLIDDAWCRGKGGYKLLQYMAVGIPCVASPVGINKEIINDGLNGFLVINTQEWIDRLSALIEDKKLRIAMGVEGRRRAESIYSYQANISKLVDIIMATKNKKV